LYEYTNDCKRIPTTHIFYWQRKLREEACYVLIISEEYTNNVPFLFEGDIMNSKEYFKNEINQTKEGDCMSTVIAQKWGNSIGMRIPKEAADRLGISQGYEIELYANENEITLKPKRIRKKYTLEELLSQVTPENRHEEIDFGIEGRELI
jgi:antitoxin MazE